MKKLSKLIIVALISFMVSGDILAQINESFTGVTFPPLGWTRTTYIGTAGVWVRSTTSPRTVPGCAFSLYTFPNGDNYLKTPQFTPIADDSIIFYLRQTFSTVYPDTLQVLVSTTDTSKASFSLLLNLADGINYPAAGTYGRFSASLAAYSGVPIYIAFRHRDADGDEIRLDDISTLSPPPVSQDMGVSNLVSSLGVTVCPGQTIDLTATAKNFGTTTQNIVPVNYTVNGGSPVGPVNTVGPIIQNGTEDVIFNGANSFTPLTSGTYKVRAFTSLPGDQNPANDTFAIEIVALNLQSVYPYVETFTNPVGWTLPSALWKSSTTFIVGPTNPDGKLNDTAAFADFYSASSGTIATMTSRPMNFTGLTHPVIHFYVAYRTFSPTTQEDDSLQILISTDCGTTFTDVPVQYRRSQVTAPSLATRNALPSDWKPDSSGQWRHETIDLLQYANSASVIIGFRGISRFGNNCFIDNFIATNADDACSINVPGLGVYSCNPLVAIDVTSPNSPVRSSNELTDLSFGGEMITTQHDNETPPTIASPDIAINGAATTQDLSVFTPDYIGTENWWTVTYSGNDRNGYVKYNISVDATAYVSIAGVNLDKVYIMKRTDLTGSWVCLNTTRAGNILTASGLDKFSDFCLGGQQSTFPVELSSFVSVINGRDVTLNWTTATETNNSGFDIERSIVNGEWSMVGNVTGNGTSTTPHSYTYTDRAVNSGKYNYRLKQIDLNGNYEYFNLSNEVNVGVPTKFDLSQNYPNPFNPSTKINYDLPFDGKVSIKVFDISGKEAATLVNDVKTAGYYTINFNASNLSSGVYFYRISAEANGQNFVSTKKMMLIK